MQTRKNLLEQWTAAVAAGKDARSERVLTAEFISKKDGEGVKNLSRATLHRWKHAYRQDGIEGLADTRWSTNPGDEPVLAA